MINKVASQNTLLSSQKTKITNRLQEMLEKNNPEKAQSLRTELGQARQILSQIQSSKIDTNKERQAAAQQKIEKLKAQIEALSMTAISDPEGTARKAARLARELAEATREYVKAGGKPSFSGNVSTNAPASNSPSTESTQSASETNASSAIEPSSISSNKSTSENDFIISAKEKTPSEEELKGTTSSAQYITSIRNNINSRIEEVSNRASSTDEDQAFASKVRGLIMVLKNIIKTAKNKLETGEEDTDNKDITEAEKALAETENLLDEGTLNTISSATVAAVNILA